jgi:hypothetical protein
MDDYLDSEDFYMLELLIDELHDHVEEGADLAAHAVNERIKSIYELS